MFSFIFVKEKAPQLCDAELQVKRSKGAELQIQLDMSESFIFRPSVPALGFFVTTNIVIV